MCRGVRLDQLAPVDRPQPTQDPEEGALATPIGAGDQQVHAWLHL